MATWSGGILRVGAQNTQNSTAARPAPTHLASLSAAVRYHGARGIDTTRRIFAATAAHLRMCVPILYWLLVNK